MRPLVSKAKRFAKKVVQKVVGKLNVLQLKLLSRAAKAADFSLSEDLDYQQWLSKNVLTAQTLEEQRSHSQSWPYRPLISIIMPTYNTDLRYLRAAVDSVLAQTYDHWELCIADDHSTKTEVVDTLERYAHQDHRIRVVFRNINGHISAASNSALGIAKGEFIALLDHDDLLTPDALFEVVKLLNEEPGVDMVYSDEDKISENGMLSSPFFKPDWSPESFLSRMYTCHFGVYRKSLVDQICGFREGYEGSQDYDLVLRFTELTDKIFHIPKILYHWRIHAESSASVSDQKPYAAIAAEKALLDALSRRGEPGKVMQADCLIGHFIIRYDLKDEPLVSIIIPTRDHGEILDTCLESIFTKTNYQNFEIILIDNGSVEERALEVIKHWQVKEPGRFKCYPLDIPFNYSKINNFGVSKASGEYLLFLNNDTEVCNADWLHGLLEQAQRDAIGAVGAKLLYPDNTIQHFGVVVGLGGVAGHAHLNLPKESPGYFGLAMTVNNFLAVTGACFMLRKDVFKLVGGFEEKLAVAFNDVDLCLKVHEAGFRNVCLPHVVLYHYESKSRGKDTTPERQKRFQQEVSYMLEKWKKYIEFDPYYNPNLTLINPSHRIDSSGRFLVKS